MRGIIVGILAIVIIIGCSGSKTLSRKAMPDFVLNPPKEAGALFGTGIADEDNPQLAKEIADLRAKMEIASALSQKVWTMIQDYLEQVGISKKTEFADLAKSITRALTDVELVGVTIEKREFRKGKMFTLARYSLNESMKKLVYEAVRKSFSSKEALLAQFSANQGFEELDKQLDKLMLSQH